LASDRVRNTIPFGHSDLLPKFSKMRHLLGEFATESAESGPTTVNQTALAHQAAPLPKETM
jgi:hypothetical protein